jgi:hypothetical protein
MVTFRRFLVLAALFFWQGGFTFYASVVVPIGQSELGDLEQGFLTRRVTNYLNLSGAIALATLAWDCVASCDSMRWRRRTRAGLWLIQAVTLLALLWLHGRLEDLLVVEYRTVYDFRIFRRLHRLYLWISTVQWAATVGYIVLSLRAWKEEDSGLGTDVHHVEPAGSGSVPRQPAR